MTLSSRTGGASTAGMTTWSSAASCRCSPMLAKRHEEAPLDHPAAPARFNWHALRHFAISCWIASGLDPKTVQTFAGHSSLQVTMDRYGHLFPSEDHNRAMDAIAKEMFG